MCLAPPYLVFQKCGTARIWHTTLRIAGIYEKKGGDPAIYKRDRETGSELLEADQLFNGLTTADQARHAVIKQHFRQQRAAVVV